MMDAKRTVLVVVKAFQCLERVWKLWIPRRMLSAFYDWNFCRRVGTSFTGAVSKVFDKLAGKQANFPYTLNIFLRSESSLTDLDSLIFIFLPVVLGMFAVLQIRAPLARKWNFCWSIRCRSVFWLWSFLCSVYRTSTDEVASGKTASCSYLHL